MKLKCNAIQRFISDYIDKTLSDHNTRRIETHLECCQMCQRELNALKKTRDLVVDFYVEPIASDGYYHQFEVELYRSIADKGPIRLSDRLKTSVIQWSWYLLTQLRQSFGRYSLFRMNGLPLSVLFLLIITGFVATHLLKQDVSPPYKVFPQQVNEEIVASESAMDDRNTKLRIGIYSDSKTKRKAPGKVGSPALTADAEKIGYWKLAEPLVTETEGHIIVMQVSNDRSAPSDASDSELLVYAQPDILSRKSPLQEDNDYASHPLDLQVSAFLEKYQRKHRRFSPYVDKLMNVPSEIHTIPESYDNSKL